MAGFDLTKLINWTSGLIPSATDLNDGLTSLIRASGGPRQASPPGSPTDQDQWLVVLDSANGIVCEFKQNTGSGSAYKWERTNSDIYVPVATSETTTSTTYVDLATVGPSFTVPRAGDWDIWTEIDASNATGGVAMLAGPKKGAAAVADQDAAKPPPNTIGVSACKSTRFTGMAASDVVKLQYKTSAGTATFLNRVLRVRPIRLS